MEEALGRSLATGNTAEIFEWGPRVMKLYKSPAAKRAAFHEAATSAAVESLGLPVAKVWDEHEVGSRWGVVFDRVTQKSFADQMLGNPDNVPRYLECMVRLEPVQLDGPPGNDFAEIPEDEPIVADLEIVTALFPQTGSQHHVRTIELKKFPPFVAGWFHRSFRLVFGAVQQFAVANDAADGVRRCRRRRHRRGLLPNA